MTALPGQPPWVPAGVRRGGRGYLGRGGERVGAALVGVVHQLLQGLQELQQQRHAQLVGMVTVVRVAGAPLAELRVGVQTVGRQIGRASCRERVSSPV